MPEQRIHPDLFTPQEALEYLHMPYDSDRSFDTFKEQGILTGAAFGRTTLYHRDELDALVIHKFAFVEQAKRTAKISPAAQPESGPRLRIGNGK